MFVIIMDNRFFWNGYKYNVFWGKDIDKAMKFPTEEKAREYIKRHKENEWLVKCTKIEKIENVKLRKVRF